MMRTINRPPKAFPGRFAELCAVVLRECRSSVACSLSLQTLDMPLQGFAVKCRNPESFVGILWQRLAREHIDRGR